jgi:hypothetical protein
MEWAWLGEEEQGGGNGMWRRRSRAIYGRQSWGEDEDEEAEAKAEAAGWEGKAEGDVTAAGQG